MTVIDNQGTGCRYSGIPCLFYKSIGSMYENILNEIICRISIYETY